MLNIIRMKFFLLIFLLLFTTASLIKTEEKQEERKIQEKKKIEESINKLLSEWSGKTRCYKSGAKSGISSFCLKAEMRTYEGKPIVLFEDKVEANPIINVKIRYHYKITSFCQLNEFFTPIKITEEITEEIPPDVAKKLEEKKEVDIKGGKKTLAPIEVIKESGANVEKTDNGGYIIRRTKAIDSTKIKDYSENTLTFLGLFRVLELAAINETKDVTFSLFQLFEEISESSERGGKINLKLSGLEGEDKIKFNDREVSVFKYSNADSQEKHKYTFFVGKDDHKIYKYQWNETEYSLFKESNMKVVFIIAKDGFRDEEFREPKRILEKAGYTVDVASSSKGTCKGMLGATAQANLTINDISEKNYDGIIFIGGVGAKEYWDNKTAHKLVKDFYQAQKLVGAICIAPVTLANAGILKGKEATAYPSVKEDLEVKGATYKPANCVVSDKVVTASGPEAAVEFGKKILDILSK